jgi:uncharacterized protein (TIGR03437 family)
LGAQIVNGAVTSSLGGYRVLFNGIQAPLLYAGPNQINGVVPEEVFGQDTATVLITTPQGTITGPTVYVQPSQPGVFHTFGLGDDLAAALNQNLTVNSATNPAGPGTIVSIWATGAGTPSSGSASDGTIGAAGSLTSPLLPVSILWQPTAPDGGRPIQTSSLEVLYAGDAPGDVSGVLQVNFRIPDRLPAAIVAIAFYLQIGSSVSPVTLIYVHA